ncbi:hypothetical protein G6F70_002366 [Rhizopus microsporus]|nr:hypothetical protein G6F71_003163 [Rhizopus microsporus]KAG1202331.1 hypothetical protein G6F70_002366 [Rhizopus microsporus]KAG1214075.1 hypothetical protein G6F69_002261 [Rhizopus microsporus]KAG1236384.1 hypothetical protein G6F67_002038 [Rhizopus microsporus]KAG1267427.1 hypothetical protein G6F68_001941 [Rhizopus microsporus]
MRESSRKEKKRESEISIKKARMKKSIKNRCSDYINRYFLTDGAMEAKCKWGHPNYNPCDVQEITSSRIPSEVKQWIEERFSS